MQYAYTDTPLHLGYGSTISTPHMVAIMYEALELRKGLRVLEVGTGSDYHVATIGYIISGSTNSEDGHVFSIEIIPDLIRFALKNLIGTVTIENITLIFTDGSNEFPEAAPYDMILVTAASPDIPQSLLAQLTSGGVMVVSVGGHSSFHSLMVIKKDESDRVSIEERGGCSFVPLLDKFGFDP